MSKRSAEEMSNLSSSVDALMAKGPAAVADCYGDEKKQFALQSFLLQAAAASGAKMDDKLRSACVDELNALGFKYMTREQAESEEESEGTAVTKDTIQKLVKAVAVIGKEDSKVGEVSVTTVVYRIAGHYYSLRVENKGDMKHCSVEATPFGRVGDAMSFEGEEGDTERDCDFDERGHIHGLDWMAALQIDDMIDPTDAWKACGVTLARLAMQHVPELNAEGILPLFIEKIKAFEPEETEMECEDESGEEIVEEDSGDDE